MWIRARLGCAFQVDLGAEGIELTGHPDPVRPLTNIEILTSPRKSWQAYPLVDHVADKVCATMQRYGSRPSSREKDLVDIVVLATTHDVGGAALSRAITAEMRRRRLNHFDQFVVPSE